MQTEKHKLASTHSENGKYYYNRHGFEAVVWQTEFGAYALTVENVLVGYYRTRAQAVNFLADNLDLTKARLIVALKSYTPSNTFADAVRDIINSNTSARYVQERVMEWEASL